MTEEKLGARAAAAKSLVCGTVGAEPAAVAAHTAAGPVDEDAAARIGVAAAESRPAAAGDLLQQSADSERVCEIADRQAWAVVAKTRSLGALREPRLRACSRENRVQLGDCRLLVCGVPGMGEAAAQVA